MKQNTKSMVVALILVVGVVPFASATISYFINLQGDVEGASEEGLVQFQIGASSSLALTIEDGGSSFEILDFPFVAGMEVSVNDEVLIANLGSSSFDISLELDDLGNSEHFESLEIYVNNVLIADLVSPQGTFTLPSLTTFDIKMVAHVGASVVIGTPLGFGLSFTSVIDP